MRDIEETIRERAYHLWAAGGCQDGNAVAYWLAAQREVLASSLGGFGSAEASPSASKKVARKAKDASAIGRRKARAV